MALLDTVKIIKTVSEEIRKSWRVISNQDWDHPEYNEAAVFFRGSLTKGRNVSLLWRRKAIASYLKSTVPCLKVKLHSSERCCTHQATWLRTPGTTVEHLFKSNPGSLTQVFPHHPNTNLITIGTHVPGPLPAPGCVPTVGGTQYWVARTQIKHSNMGYGCPKWCFTWCAKSPLLCLLLNT